MSSYYCGICHAAGDHNGTEGAAMQVTYVHGQPSPDLEAVTHPSR